MSETVLITRSSSSTDRRMVRGAADALAVGVAGRRDSGAAAPSAPGASASISALSSPAGISSPASIAATISPMRSMIAEHRADQRAVGLAAAGANVGERVLGGVAQRLQPRKFEEAAIALHGVDEAENAVEPRAVVGLGFPGDDLAAQRFEHFAAFGYEIGNQIVHRRARPQRWLRGRYAARS